MLPWTTFSAAIHGDDLETAIVAGGMGRARSRRGPTLHGFLSMTSEEARRALAFVPSGARVLLVCDAPWCCLRPIPITCSRWAEARDEIRRGIEGFFPIPASEALVGLLDRAEAGDELAVGGDTAAGSGGYLIAIHERAIRPWIDGLVRAIGREPNAVLSPHMALAGIGLQHHPEARVLEQMVTGSIVEHRLRWGEVVELGRAADGSIDSDLPSAALPGLMGSNSGRTLTAADLAIGAALAERAARGRFSPLAGGAPASAPAWLPIAACLAAAAGIFLATGAAEDWRLRRSISEIEGRAVKNAALLAEVGKARDETLRLTADLNAAAKRLPAAPLLADLAAAQAVVPRGGFLYRIEVDRRGVTIKGEASNAGDVLRGVEATPEFQGAREQDIAVPIEERGSQQFTIQAERAPVQPEGSAAK